MFGGVYHLIQELMFCGVYKDFLILRLGAKNAEKAFDSHLVRPFDITGRPMRGWVMVEMKGVKGDEEIEGWLEMARKFVLTLPPK